MSRMLTVLAPAKSPPAREAITLKRSVDPSRKSRALEPVTAIVKPITTGEMPSLPPSALPRRVPSRHLPAVRSGLRRSQRSEEHTSELQSLMRTSYAVFCLQKKKTSYDIEHTNTTTDKDNN